MGDTTTESSKAAASLPKRASESPTRTSNPASPGDAVAEAGIVEVDASEEVAGEVRLIAVSLVDSSTIVVSSGYRQCTFQPSSVPTHTMFTFLTRCIGRLCLRRRPVSRRPPDHLLAILVSALNNRRTYMLSCRASETTSLASSIRHHQFENGRRYHSYKSGSTVPSLPPNSTFRFS